VDFLHFRPSNIHISPSGIVSSLFPPQCRLSPGRCRYAVTPCHTSFAWSQNEFSVYASSFGKALSRRLPSRAKIEALDPHHHRRSPSLDRPTHTLYCYKRVILILITLPTTQSRLHFTSSLARAPRYRSSIHRRPTPIISPHNNTHGDKLADPLSLSEPDILKSCSIT
jgi:hypothetical protein